MSSFLLDETFLAIQPLIHHCILSNHSGMNWSSLHLRLLPGFSTTCCIAPYSIHLTASSASPTKPLNEKPECLQLKIRYHLLHSRSLSPSSINWICNFDVWWPFCTLFPFINVLLGPCKNDVATFIEWNIELHCTKLTFDTWKVQLFF